MTNRGPNDPQWKKPAPKGEWPPVVQVKLEPVEPEPVTVEEAEVSDQEDENNGDD